MSALKRPAYLMLSMINGVCAMCALRLLYPHVLPFRDEVSLDIAAIVMGTLLAWPLLSFLGRRQIKARGSTMIWSVLAGIAYGFLVAWLAPALATPLGIMIDAINHLEIKGLGPLAQAPQPLVVFATVVLALLSGAFYGVIAPAVHAPFVIAWGLLVGTINGLIVKTLLLKASERSP
jgi:predicted PurR-regulated permease PerM